MNYGKMLGGMLSGAWEKAGKVAESISGSSSFQKYYNQIAPGLDAMKEEAVSSYATRLGYKTVSAEMAQGQSEAAAKAIQKIRSEDDIAKVSEKFGLDIKDEFQDRLLDYAHKKGDAIHDFTSSFEGLNPLDRAKETTIAYFTNPDKAIRKTRIATAAGAYGALTVGRRYMSGGTLTTDQYGRHDIAGVPFI